MQVTGAATGSGRNRSYALPSSLLGTAKHVGDAVADAALDFMEAHRTNGVPFYLQFHEYPGPRPAPGARRPQGVL